jgi:GT2 family glycosyltransferase
MPTVSVVVPTFGRSALLLRAVRTVLNQTMADLELLVVIDGDDPATLAALATLDERRLRVYSNPEKLGAARTRDRGVALSTGDWVAFLDDDDEWLPHKLQQQLSLAGDRPALVSCLSRVVTPHASFLLPERPYDGATPFDEWMFDRPSWLGRGAGFLQTSSLLVPRSLFEHLGFAVPQHEEWELVLRATKQLDYLLLTVPEPLVVHYRDEPRPSLSGQYRWQQSAQWAESLGPLLTRRAYSGFLLSSLSRDAQGKGECGAALALLLAAFRHGSPTLRQLFAYASIWSVPRGWRRQIRALLEHRAPDWLRRQPVPPPQP